MATGTGEKNVVPTFLAFSEWAAVPAEIAQGTKLYPLFHSLS